MDPVFDSVLSKWKYIGFEYGFGATLSLMFLPLLIDPESPVYCLSGFWWTWAIYLGIPFARAIFCWMTCEKRDIYV